MIITQDRLVKSVHAPVTGAIYEILLLMKPECDMDVAQVLADKEQQPVLVYRATYSQPGAYEKSTVYPNLEMRIDHTG